MQNNLSFTPTNSQLATTQGSRPRAKIALALVVLLVSTMLAGCGLFGGAEREREEQNEDVAQGIELGDVVTAEGIGSNNEPINESNDFSDTQDVIYVVAEVDYIEEGTTLFARWYRDDEPIEDSTQIVADRDYSDTYLEFHLTNLEDRFETGDYSVQIIANGNVIEEEEFRIN